MDEYTEEKPILPPVEISPEAISTDILNAIIENFIAREGTDYGWEETAHATKLDQISRNIKKGQIRIVFDPNSESVTLITEKEYLRLTASF
jgi:uncharacterized protein